MVTTCKSTTKALSNNDRGEQKSSTTKLLNRTKYTSDEGKLEETIHSNASYEIFTNIDPKTRGAYVEDPIDVHRESKFQNKISHFVLHSPKEEPRCCETLKINSLSCRPIFRTGLSLPPRLPTSQEKAIAVILLLHIWQSKVFRKVMSKLDKEFPDTQFQVTFPLYSVALLVARYLQELRHRLLWFQDISAVIKAVRDCYRKHMPDAGKYAALYLKFSETLIPLPERQLRFLQEKYEEAADYPGIIYNRQKGYAFKEKNSQNSIDKSHHLEGSVSVDNISENIDHLVGGKINYDMIQISSHPPAFGEKSHCSTERSQRLSYIEPSAAISGVPSPAKNDLGRFYDMQIGRHQPPRHGSGDDEASSQGKELGPGDLVWRRATMFHLQNENFPVDIRQLAEAGFYLQESQDEMRCFCCSLTIPKGQWRREHVPLQIHEQRSPMCPLFNPTRDQPQPPNQRPPDFAEVVQNSRESLHQTDENTNQSRDTEVPFPCDCLLLAIPKHLDIPEVHEETIGPDHSPIPVLEFQGGLGSKNPFTTEDFLSRPEAIERHDPDLETDDGDKDSDEEDSSSRSEVRNSNDSSGHLDLDPEWNGHI